MTGGRSIRFSTEEEAREFARSQPPGVIGVVPSTVTLPGEPKWQERAATLADVEARLKAKRNARITERLSIVSRVVQWALFVFLFACIGLLFACIVYSAHALHELSKHGIAIHANACIGLVQPPHDGADI